MAGLKCGAALSFACHNLALRVLTPGIRISPLALPDPDVFPLFEVLHPVRANGGAENSPSLLQSVLRIAPPRKNTHLQMLNFKRMRGDGQIPSRSGNDRAAKGLFDEFTHRRSAVAVR